MSLLQGAYWISDQHLKKYLNAGADNVVGGASAPSPRGLDPLNSTAPRTQIWLIEKATDGKNYRFRNYETGTALDLDDRQPGNGTPIVVKDGNSESQVWEVNWIKGSALGGIFHIKNVLVSKALSLGSLDNYPAITWTPHNRADQEWLFEPVLLPTLYWLANAADPALVLRASDRPNASDNSSCGVALVPKDPSVRNQLWAFEYTSVDECILRNALHNQFVLDLSAEDSQTLLAREHHGGPNQRWRVADEDKNNHIVSFANVKTNTLLATRRQQLSGNALDTLVAVVEGNTRWRLYSSPQPPLFWVTIQNRGTGAFLAQARDGSIVASMGALHANDHTVQWRFIILGGGSRYVIMNRATGFVLDHHARARSGVSIVAEDDDRNNPNHHWILESVGDTHVGIVNVGSNCALDHFARETIQAYVPGPSNPYRHWIITPFYDTLPSFALVNLYTGRSIANCPDPDAGTIVVSNNINSFESQWLFYHPINEVQSDPEYALLNKLSGNVLEYFRDIRIEAQDVSHSGPHQKWKLLPLRGRLFALANAATQQFLYDPGEYNIVTDELLPDDNRVLCWHLVSHRESGFDFISLDFDILQRLIPYISPRPAEALQRVMVDRLPAGEKKMKGKDKTAHIPRAARITRIANSTLRAVLARLVELWAEDSIPETSQPHTIASTNRREVEGQWGISLSERALRCRSGESGWARIDLQGIYNVDGSQLANIQGQWLEVPIFQVIVPAGLCIGRATIRRAMLQSLDEGLTVEIRVTPATQTSTTNVGKHLSTTPRPPGPGAGNGRMNSLALALGMIPISSLKHDEL